MPLDTAPPLAVRASPMRAGSKFVGLQRSGRDQYSVTLRILSSTHSSCCGTISIAGLTPSLPLLRTYFEGEIIGGPGKTNGFHTGRWGADERTDYEHWQRFSAFRGIRKELTPDGKWKSASANKRNVLFMRFKEQFVLPNDGKTPESIHGASFAGFYYVCLDLSPPLEIEKNTPPPSPRLSRGPFSSLIPDWAQAPHRDTRPRSTFGYVDSKEDSADEDESHESRSTSPASTARHESLLRAQRLQDLSYAAVVAGVSPPLVASHQHGDATPKEDVSTTVLPIQEWPPPPPSPRLARSVLPVPPISPSPSLQGTGLKTPREKAPKRLNPAWSRATMSGFYFHANSEPYQELSLQFVPAPVSESFAFR